METIVVTTDPVLLIGNLIEPPLEWKPVLAPADRADGALNLIEPPLEWKLSCAINCLSRSNESNRTTAGMETAYSVTSWRNCGKSNRTTAGMETIARLSVRLHLDKI